MLTTAVTWNDAKNIKSVDAEVFDLDSAYMDFVTTEPKDNRQGVFHPSATGGCGRRSVYEFNGAPRSYTNALGLLPAAKLTQKQDIFRIGHAVHGFTQTIMGELARVLGPKNIEFEFEAEKPFDPVTDTLWLDFGIGGTTDGILTVWHTVLGWRQKIVIEIKTCKDEVFEKLTGPKEDHLMQANLYAFRFDCPIIIFWYFNKNNSDRKVFRRLADEKYLEMAINYFDKLGDHVRAGTLPDREESYMMCPECEYSHLCKPEVLTRIQGRASVNKMIKRGGFGKSR